MPGRIDLPTIVQRVTIDTKGMEDGQKRATRISDELNRSLNKQDREAESTSRSHEKLGKAAHGTALGFAEERDSVDRSTKVHERHRTSVDHDTNALTRFAKEAKKASIGNIAGGLIGTMKVPAIVGGINLLSAGVTALGTATFALGAQLAPLVGTAGAIPGLGLAAISTALGLKVLVTDAGSAAAAIAKYGTNSKEAKAELDKIAPSSRKFAVELGVVKKSLDEIKAAGQAAALPKFGDALKQLQGLTPVLKEGFVGLSSTLGNVVLQFSQTLNSSAFKRDLSTIFANNNRLVATFGSALGPIAVALNRIVLAAAPMTQMFANWVAHSAEALAIWTGNNSDRMTKFFNNAAKVTGEVARGFRDLGIGLKNLGVIANESIGIDFIKNIENGGKKFKEFTESTSGKNTIAAYFEQAGPVLHEFNLLLIDVFKTFLDIGTAGGLVDTLRLLRTDLLPAFADLSKDITQRLGPALVEAGTAFLKFWNILSYSPLVTLIEAISKLTIAFANLISKVPGLGQVVATILMLQMALKGLEFAAAKTGLASLAGFIGGRGSAAAASSGWAKFFSGLTGGAVGAAATKSLVAGEAAAAAPAIAIPVSRAVLPMSGAAATGASAAVPIAGTAGAAASGSLASGGAAGILGRMFAPLAFGATKGVDVVIQSIGKGIAAMGGGAANTTPKMVALGSAMKNFSLTAKAGTSATAALNGAMTIGYAAIAAFAIKAVTEGVRLTQMVKQSKTAIDEWKKNPLDKDLTKNARDSVEQLDNKIKDMDHPLHGGLLHSIGNLASGVAAGWMKIFGYDVGKKADEQRRALDAQNSLIQGAAQKAAFAVGTSPAKMLEEASKAGLQLSGTYSDMAKQFTEFWQIEMKADKSTQDLYASLKIFNDTSSTSVQRADAFAQGLSALREALHPAAEAASSISQASAALKDFGTSMDGAVIKITKGIASFDPWNAKNANFIAGLTGMATQFEAVASDVYKQTGSVDSATAAYQRLYDQLVGQISKGFGITKQQAEDLVNQILSTPDQIETTYDTPGLQDAILKYGNVQDALAYLQANPTITTTYSTPGLSAALALTGDYTSAIKYLQSHPEISTMITVYAQYSKDAQTQHALSNWGLGGQGSVDYSATTGAVIKQASGGYIAGPGSGTSDSVPAMLSNGEYVLQASTVGKLGRGFLDALNQGKIEILKVRKMMLGGLADGSSGTYLNQAPSFDFQEELMKALAGLPSRLTAQQVFDYLANNKKPQTIDINVNTTAQPMQSWMQYVPTATTPTKPTQQPQPPRSNENRVINGGTTGGAGTTGGTAGTGTAASAIKGPYTAEVKDVMAEAKKIMEDYNKVGFQGAGIAAAKAYMMSMAKGIKDSQKTALEAQKSALDALQSQAESAMESISGTMQGFGSITSAWSKANATPSSIIQTMQDRLSTLTGFSSGLSTLQGRGLNNQSLQEILNAGPDEGSAIVDAMKYATADQIKQINSLQDAVLSVSDQLGLQGAQYTVGDKMLAEQKKTNALLTAIGKGNPKLIDAINKLPSTTAVAKTTTPVAAAPVAPPAPVAGTAAAKYYSVTVNNPIRETAEESILRRLRVLETEGVAL